MSSDEMQTMAGIEVELPLKRENSGNLQDTLTKNAYNSILPARYLQRDEDGKLIEDPEDLFERVAKNIALGDLPYLDEDITITLDHIKPDHPRRQKLFDEVFGAGESSKVLEEKDAKWLSYDAIIDDLSSEAAEALERRREDFQQLMERLGFMPNSPTLMNAGDELQQLSACFVDSPADDIQDIHQTEEEAALIFQSGGGMGYGFWKLRPYGDTVGSTGGIASGPITFMRTYDQMCETIAQGGKRRGAQMGVMRISHPDVVEFIHAKNKDVSLANTLKLNDPDDFTNNSFGEALEEARDLIDDEGRVPEHLRNAVEGHLSNFNISVGVTDGFMEALEAGEEYTLTNPRTEEPHIATEETKEMYSRYGFGEHVEVGEPLSIPAEKLWDQIVEGAHENGEPGVIYLERVNKRHSFDIDEHPDHQILATNPCGEQPLEEYEACNLGHINLSTLVSEDTPDWREFSKSKAGEEQSEIVREFLEEAVDWYELDKRIQLGTHFLENVVTMSNFPIPEIEEKVGSQRKIGLGIMGLAQMYIQMGVKYGSPAANEIAEQVMTHINYESKWTSHELAKERGSFDVWDESKFAEPQEYADWFEHHTGLNPERFPDGLPIRNHNTTTIAPTGTTSMIGNTSGGCEPIPHVAYYKNVSDDVQGDEMLVEFDDYFLRTLEANDLDVAAVKEEAQSQMEANEYDGIESLDSVPDEIGELFVVTSDLSGIDHAAVQCACQKGVDSAISKTVNAPHDSTLSDADEAFRYIYEHGGKGVTYYRDGSRSKQVITTRAKNSEFSDEEEEQEPERSEKGVSEPAQADVDSEKPFIEKEERPASLPSSTQRVSTGYGKLYVSISDKNGVPFEVFVNMGNSGGFTNGFTEALGKAISTGLRSGVDPAEYAQALQGIRSPQVGWDNGEQISSIPDAVGVALTRHMAEETEASDRGKAAGSEDAGAGVEADAGDASELIARGENPECNDCGVMMEMSEGCRTCPSCGNSKC